MGCISKFSKYIIFFFNFLIAVCAAVLIAFGVIYIINEGEGVPLFNESFSLGGLAVGVGVVVFLIAFLGCCGAIKENTCLLTTYGIIMIAIFVVQVVLGTLAIVKIHDGSSFKQEIEGLVQELFDNKVHVTDQAFENIQSNFKCCGVKGPQDYLTGVYDKSCCVNGADPCYNPFTTGCALAVADVAQDNITIIGGVAIGFAVVEFLGAMFAFMVRKQSKEYV